MATVLRASPVTWLPYIQQQLVAVTGLPVERVIITARLNPQPMAQTQDILIRPGAITGSQNYLQGSGRLVMYLKRALHITIRTRQALDQPESDQQWLINLQLGHFVLEDKVYDALQGYQPVDMSGNALLATPINFLGGPDPSKIDQNEDNNDFGFTTLTFEVEYVQPLQDASVPNL
jgi:hypothetical protein